MGSRNRRQPGSLEQLDLKGYGRFEPDRKAAFTISTLNLPASWEYIYQNGDIMLKVDQFGPTSAQIDPPKDIVLFRREPYQRFSSWLAWVRSPELRCRAFTSFLRPVFTDGNPSEEPDRVEITFEPAKATWIFEYEGLRCTTEVFVPSRGPAVCFHLSVTSLREETTAVSLIPVLRPYVNPALLAPWDKPEWYLKTGFCMTGKPGFWTHLLNMNSEFDKRRAAVVWCDGEDAAGAEISHERFVGNGTFEKPEAVWDGRLRLPAQSGGAWGEYGEANTIYGFPPVHALQYDRRLGPGETTQLRLVLAAVPTGPLGALPEFDIARGVRDLLEETRCVSEQRKVQETYERFAGARSVRTPDGCLNRYANEWLPLQLEWVASLDRGWPTGMRGSRDSANDFTALVPHDPARSRAIIETVLSCQRSDGWFPRQYSASGRSGRHDLRGYVDAGCFIIELLYEYVCFTKDFGLLDRRLPWLDSDEESTVLEHGLRAIGYYLDEGNLGEHGLCKIGEGDWLDAVNRAGLAGRGESVTVTNQAVIALVQMGALVDHLRGRGGMPEARAKDLLELYESKRKAFAGNLRRHALNREGYFNGVFNDDGRWLFSERDPDGRRRVYGPANWFSIISGVAVPDLVDSILKQLSELKCAAGYRLFQPPMGDPPIMKVGRVGTGDVPPGLNENATVYNHGAQGFLGRALAVAGRGDLLYEVLQYMLPYDQARHPVEETMSPPYAVVNAWQDVPLFGHRGGMMFLTGSIAYATRLVYDWLCGIRPLPAGLSIDPCVPAEFKSLRADFRYLKGEVQLEIRNPGGRESGVRSMTLNGERIEKTAADPFSGRTMFAAADEFFTEPTNRIVVTL